MSTVNIKEVKNMEERKFQDIIDALMSDDVWEVPVEERPIYLDGLGWTILDA